MNPYKVLGIANDATPDDIKQAYLTLARQHHPDTGGDANKFKEAQQAYDILSNKQPSSPEPTHPHHINPADLTNLFTQGGHPFGDIFSQFSNRQTRQQPVKLHTDDSEIQFNLRANLEQIKNGATTTIAYNRNIACPDCRGIGGEQKTHCAECRGAGVITIRHGPTMLQQHPCASCNGRGVIWQNPCRKCQTNGYVQQAEQIKVKIGEDK
tara:strand:+ start:14355 stop:14984 length:630 start_codon:yes stop_codon:yes gene_type:complete